MARWLWVLDVRSLTLLGSIALGCSVEAGSISAPSTGAGSGFGVGGGPSVAGGTSTAGSIGFGKGGATATPETCDLSPVGSLFAGQVVRNAGRLPQVFYSWTTREEIEALRRDQVLFAAEQAQKDRGYAFTFIAGLAADSNRPSSQAAAKIVSGELFANSRHAWPNPWATRRGWPGEEQGDQLVRIELKASAWVARVTHGTLEVVDLAGVKVSDADLAQSPERIGAIFFVKDWEAGGPACGTARNNLAMDIGGVGYREFILGNEAMVEQWSIGTSIILDRLVADAALLSQFLERIRPCSPFQGGQFNLTASCAWEGANAGSTGDETPYLNSLSLPSEYYASTGEIAKTIDMLSAELFEPDPLVIRPGG